MGMGTGGHSTPPRECATHLAVQLFQRVEPELEHLALGLALRDESERLGRDGDIGGLAPQRGRRVKLVGELDVEENRIR